MRKFIIALTFILSGCTSITLFSENDNCITVNEFEVLQALDNGALAYECTLWDGCSVWNQTVFLTKQLNVDYYDGMIVKSPKDKCAVIDGVYRYESKDERIRTVPIIRFEYKNPPKSEEEFLERASEFKEIVNDECITTMKSQENKEDKKFCSCYANELKEAMVKFHTENEKFNADLVNAKIRKKCGKLPKYLE